MRSGKSTSRTISDASNENKLNEISISDVRLKIQELKEMGELVKSVLDLENIEQIDQIMLEYQSSQAHREKMARANKMKEYQQEISRK